MKKITILICVLAFAILEASAVGLDSKAMAMRTNLARLRNINNLKNIPIGLDVETHMKAKKLVEANDEYIRRIQRISILLAVNFTVWNKRKISDTYDIGDRISTYIPFLLMAQMPLSKFGIDANSVFLRNFIVGVWLGYYMDGRKTDYDNYKNKYSTFMIGVLATLYMNEFLSITDSAFLLYVTLKMGIIFEKDQWGYDGGKNVDSWTKFGIFPAVGAEYFFINSLAVFAAIGYNPYGWMELGLRLNLGK